MGTIRRPAVRRGLNNSTKRRFAEASLFMGDLNVRGLARNGAGDEQRAAVGQPAHALELGADAGELHALHQSPCSIR